jgi:hypothetical protein
MQTIEGKYKNGRVRLDVQPRSKRERKATVILHDSEEIPVVPGKRFRKLIGLVELGGNAVEDTERLYL